MMDEVDGIEFCSVHGGILIEGETDDVCQYGMLESATECAGVTLFTETVELREALAIRTALLNLKWDDREINGDSWEPESAYDMERMLWQFARGEL